MCWTSKEKSSVHGFNSAAERDAYDAKLRKQAEEAKREQAERDAHAREAQAFHAALDIKVAKAKRNMQLVPVAAR